MAESTSQQAETQTKTCSVIHSPFYGNIMCCFTHWMCIKKVNNARTVPVYASLYLFQAFSPTHLLTWTAHRRQLYTFSSYVVSNHFTRAHNKLHSITYNLVRLVCSVYHFSSVLHKCGAYWNAVKMDLNKGLFNFFFYDKMYKLFGQWIKTTTEWKWYCCNVLFKPPPAFICGITNCGSWLVKHSWTQNPGL